MENDAPSGMIVSALEDLRMTADLEGVAVIDCSDESEGPALVYGVGIGGADVLAGAARLLGKKPDGPAHGAMPDGRQVIVSPWVLPPGRRGGLALWRGVGERPWATRDHEMAAVTAGLVRVMLENGPDDSGIDRLTGLPNRLYFLDEADRRMERLSQDRVPGTLMLISIDDLDAMTEAHGRSARHWVLARVAALLRAMVRPTDLVARVAQDEFAAWLDGADHMTAAERAEALCGRRMTLPEVPGRATVSVPPLSVGIASRESDSGEDVRVMLVRARGALRRVRQGGGGGWRVASRGT